MYREYNNNILQRLKRGENGTLIWQMNNMDARGRPFFEKTGNGVETYYKYRFDNDQGGQLSNIRVHNGTENIMHRNYVYYSNNAQLQEREDILPQLFGDILLPTFKEVFTYDKHRRIKTSQSTYGLTVGDLYTYGYDKLGNITSKPDSGHLDYTYGQGIAIDNAGPHAIKSLGSREFTYDASGNLLNDGEREARWKTFEKPEMLRKGTATIWFEYGAGNNRTRRRQGIFSTWYLDGGTDVQIERLTNSNNADVTIKYHYLANGKVVAIDEENNAETVSRYLHSDRLGSASVLTDSSGIVLERMSYDIWGQVRPPRSGSSSAVEKSLFHTKSYTGHEALADVDLVHMNGRIYDPILAKFMSADPFVQFAYNSQSYNRYSYVLNNPLGATDPTGYFSVKFLGAEISIEFSSPDEGDSDNFDNSHNGSIIGGDETGNDASRADLGVEGIEYELGIDRPSYIPEDPGERALEIWRENVDTEDLGEVVAVGVISQMPPAKAGGIFSNLAKRVKLAFSKFGRNKRSQSQSADSEVVDVPKGHPNWQNVNGPKAVGADVVRNVLPANARTFSNQKAAFQHLEKFNGIDSKLASERLHQIKDAAQTSRGGADNVLFDRSGGVWDPRTREFLGSLTEGGSKR